MYITVSFLNLICMYINVSMLSSIYGLMHCAESNMCINVSELSSICVIIVCTVFYVWILTAT